MPCADSRAVSTARSSRPLVCDLCGSGTAVFLFSSRDGDYVKCPDCGLIYGAADAADLAADYDECYDRMLAPEAGGLTRSKRWHRKAAERLKRFAADRQTGRLLEVGSGRGDFLRTVTEAGWQATGVEISAYAAAYARDRQGCDVFTGTIEQAADQLPAETFDVVWAANLLEHVTSPKAFLQCVERLLRPGGVFIGSTLNGASWAFAISGSRWQYAESARLHRFIFSPATLDRYCTVSGLKCERVETMGFRLVSKFESRRALRPIVRFVEQLVAAAAQGTGRGHRIEIQARKPCGNSRAA